MTEHDVVKIENHFGILDPSVLIEYNGRRFSLGGLTPHAIEQSFSSGLVVYEYSKGTAFVLLEDGRIFRHDLEDESIEVFNGELVFYSDAGLSVFSNKGEISCVFNDLGEYIIDINFEDIDDATIRFTLGDGRELGLTVNEIIERIGGETLENLVKNISP